MVKNYLFLQEEQSKKRGKAGKVKRIICLNFSNIKMHYVKSVEIRSFSGPYFPVFGLRRQVKLNVSFVSIFPTLKCTA